MEKIDLRNIATGWEIPSEDYCDQPYIVITPDGNWLCVMTTGQGEEGKSRQHIVATISSDKGQTWSPLTDIEPAGEKEASWAIPLLLPNGRVYAFYTYNKDNIREVIAKDPPFANGMCPRVDTLGVFAFKYSDDYGRTWSKQRYEIPVRMFDIDRDNPYQGKVRFFWSICKPIIVNNELYISASKIENFGMGFITRSEGFFVKSSNILSQTDPAGIKWETLPDGDAGLRAPEGPIAEEHYITSLSDGTLYCVYRTTQGHSCHCYSKDGGHTWTKPEYMTYTPGGQKIKHPRAANFVRKFSNGKFIYWFHNNGGKKYNSRNPVWISGGTEKNGKIYWSQPEIVLYDDMPSHRMSYPDFVEDGGNYYISETQKKIARVHKIDGRIFEMMWNQDGLNAVVRDGLVLDLESSRCKADSTIKMPVLPDLYERGGFTVDMWVKFDMLDAGQIILDSRDCVGQGIVVSVTDRGTIKLTLNGTTFGPGCWEGGYGQSESSWDCDPGVIECGKWHHIAIIADGGPKTITFVVDGKLCDGGSARPYGWSRFYLQLGDVNGSDAVIAKGLKGQIGRMRIYDRYLLTSEAISNYRAGR